MTNRIDLLVPGLLQSIECLKQAGVPLAEKSIVSRLLSKLARQPYAEKGLEQTLTTLFGLPTGQDFPRAALHHYAHTATTEPCWRACVSPVHLIADKDGLIMDAVDALHVDEAWFDEIKWLATDYGFRIDRMEDNASHTPWILSSEAPVAIKTTPLEQACYQRIDFLLPTGKDAANLRRFMTDCQMLFTHLQQKQQFDYSYSAEKPSPNAVWLWGAGGLPQHFSDSRWQRIYGNDVSLQALGALTNSDVISLPSSFHTLSSKNNENSLIILDIFNHQRFDDANALSNLLNSFESDWLKPIEEALKNKAMVASGCYPCNGYRYNIEANHLIKRLLRRITGRFK